MLDEEETHPSEICPCALPRGGQWDVQVVQTIPARGGYRGVGLVIEPTRCSRVTFTYIMYSYVCLKGEFQVFVNI